MNGAQADEFKLDAIRLIHKDGNAHLSDFQVEFLITLAMECLRRREAENTNLINKNAAIVADSIAQDDEIAALSDHLVNAHATLNSIVSRLIYSADDYPRHVSLAIAQASRFLGTLDGVIDEISSRAIDEAIERGEATITSKEE